MKHPAAILSFAVMVSFALAVPTPAAPQEFGRWWWEASAGVSGRYFENIFGSVNNLVEQSDVRLSFGLNGYLGHPALGRFRLGGDLHLADIDGTALEDADRLGLQAEFDLLPRSPYPSRLFFARQLFEYATFEDTDLFTLVGVPESNTRWGGSVRLDRGPLKGAYIGFENVRTDFFMANDAPSQGRRDETQSQVSFDWSRQNRRFQHRTRLEYRLQDFTAVDLELADLTLDIDERGTFAGSWKWQMNGTGFRRDMSLPGVPGFRVGNYRVRNRFSRDLANGDLLDLRQNLGLFRIGTGATDDTELSVIYRWRLRPGLELAPFARYSRQSSNDGRGLSSPRLGSWLTWVRDTKKINTLVSASLSYGTLQRTRPAPQDSFSEEDFSFTLSGQLSHGEAGRLQKELEIEYLRNELSLSGEVLSDLPDLGLRRDLGREDLLRARISLSRQWRSRALSGYAEWQQRLDSDVAGDFTSTTTSINLNYSDSRLSISTSLGEILVGQKLSLLFSDGVPLGGFKGGEDSIPLDVAFDDDQKSTFSAVSLSWQLWRRLRLRASWRTDDRRLLLLTAAMGQRLEASLQFQVGQIFIEGRVFETTQDFANGATRLNRGFNWTVSRRLAGWLPIVTGTQRRGVIR